LPLSLLVLVETAKMKSDVQYEVRQMKRLRQELKEQNAKAVVVKPASDPDGL
jgi:ABC-type Zn uptake system ZnuABC Zn-binding protein ZnuA